jgi:hypothetical protein
MHEKYVPLSLELGQHTGNGYVDFIRYTEGALCRCTCPIGTMQHWQHWHPVQHWQHWHPDTIFDNADRVLSQVLLHGA